MADSAESAISAVCDALPTAPLMVQIKRSTGLNIMTRSGVVYDMAGLHHVSAADASTIIVLDPNRGTTEGESAVRPSGQLLMIVAEPLTVWSRQRNDLLHFPSTSMAKAVV